MKKNPGRKERRQNARANRKAEGRIRARKNEIAQQIENEKRRKIKPSEKLREEIDGFRADIDTKLALSNAVTFIEVEM